MTIQEKLELYKAAKLLSDYWETNPKDLIAFTAFFGKAKHKKDEWNRAMRDVEAFSKLDIPSRAKMMGFNVQVE